MPEERKLVTILFADVTGSTALGETLDPEDIRALMGRYYAHAHRLIPHYGGTLEKFIGDAAMAVFGLPHAHGDDAERALAAALALRAAVSTDDVLAGRLLLRMGVNTGEVVATSDSSRGDFLVTGDAVNVAARLEQAASPGEIVVSERTADAAQAAFLFGDVRVIEVKGKRQPLRVFPLTEPRAQRQVGRPPLVGRRQDLLQLELLCKRVLEEQRPQLVSLVAPAGTGKTRLLEEFVARLDPADRFQVAAARCPPYGQALTYWPLRGLLAELLGGEISRPQVVDAFARGGYTAEDAAGLADVVLTALGMEHERASEHASIFAAWHLLVEALARQAPRIVVFEDLHWASESLLDLVEHLMHPRTQSVLLIVATSRPELLDRRPTWGGGRQNFTAMALPSLSQGQTRDLIERLAGGLPEAIHERLVERSGGNPFFLLELVRGLAELGITGQTTRPERLPDTVHAAVLARLDLLTPQERAVVQAAAVVGRSFRPSTLQAVLETHAPAELNATLDRLLARDLLVPAEGGQFTFRHVLIREVAYGTLSRVERIRLHGKLAAWLEAYAADRLDEFTELIAYHYREAALLARQATVSLELPIDPARAVHYLERAGELAGRAGAFTEARIYLQSAIDLALEADHVRLYEQLGDGVLGGDTAVNAYRKALERWRDEKVGDPRIGARLLRKLVIVHMRFPATITMRLNPEEIVAWRTEALRLAEAAGDEEERWRVRVTDLFWLNWHGNITAEEVEEGRAVALAAAAHFETQGDWVSFSEALDGYATLSNMIGAYRDALEVSKRRLSAPELPAMERGDALNMVVHAYLSLGNYEGCIATMQEELAQLRPGGPVGNLGGALAFATWAAFISGRWSEVSDLMPILKDALELVQHNPGVARIVAVSYMAALHVALAREDRAAAGTIASILHRIIPDTMPNERSLVAACLEDDLHPLDLNPASIFHTMVTLEVWITAILMFLHERGASAPAGLIPRARFWPNGMVVERVVEIAEALEASDLARLTTAIDEAEAHGLVPHAARMRIILAQRTGDRTQLKRARPVLERLGDRQFLRRLEAVAAILSEQSRTADT